jgi:hypothetical protein
MATTTNYGWTTPDDTALVKDGAAAIRTLGSSVDTTTKNLNPETTLGDIAYRSSTTNVNTRLALGTANQQLRVNSGATAPEWFTPATSGGITLITETVASGLSSLDFTSIAGTYKKLVLVWTGIFHSASGSDFNIRFNNNSTASTYISTAINNIANGSDTVGAITGSGTDLWSRTTSAPFGVNQTNNGSDRVRPARGILEIDNYASASKYKVYTFNYAHWNDVDSEYKNANGLGTFFSTTAITQINIFRGSGSATFSNISDTSIRLYGVS